VEITRAERRPLFVTRSLVLMERFTSARTMHPRLQHFSPDGVQKWTGGGANNVGDSPAISGDGTILILSRAAVRIRTRRGSAVVDANK